MFQKIITIFILLCHVNSSMFLPQVAEQDIYNSNGQQEDDINTVIEYCDKAMVADGLRASLVHFLRSLSKNQ